jgi:nucleoside-diphosphate-sugar epimerase
MPAALVVGGTGPTGPFIVRGLLERGYEVVMLHTGTHERDEIPSDVRHVHTDPFDAGAVAVALGQDRFDVGVVTYGRVRELVRALQGRLDKLVTIGGVPVLRGYGDPHAVEPPGMRVPTTEDSPTVDAGGGVVGNEKVARILETERAVFDAHPGATHFRYPLVYGPYQLLPREWMVVRRILDGRRHLIIPDGGLYLRSATFVANAAHAVLLAVDDPDTSAGRTYHVSDEWTPTLRQVVEIIAAALDHELELVDMPYDVATPAHPLMMLSGSFHRYMPSTRLAADLGYRDVVPCEEALALTARWLAEHPLEPGGREERNLQDPFAYEAEDALIAAWRRARADVRDAAGAADPLHVDRYSPGYEAARVRRRAARTSHRDAGPRS